MNKQEIDDLVYYLNKKGIIRDPQRLRYELERWFGGMPRVPLDTNYKRPERKRPSGRSKGIKHLAELSGRVVSHSASPGDWKSLGRTGIDQMR